MWNKNKFTEVVVILDPSASDCNVPRIDGDKGYSIDAYTVGTFFFDFGKNYT